MPGTLGRGTGAVNCRGPGPGDFGGRGRRAGRAIGGVRPGARCRGPEPSARGGGDARRSAGRGTGRPGVDGTVYIGSNDKKVYALDAATGQDGAS
ncbi:PQQ-binding-like beta-propeller repeat protein [Streptomyces sp. NPDC058613]|uniref:PQQ-binding-like beta-propeller repeat protein n=1 Tax=Streptomyces sp. NPDC058613 TaxID=3346556 RepID=UPI00366944A1